MKPFLLLIGLALAAPATAQPDERSARLDAVAYGAQAIGLAEAHHYEEAEQVLRPLLDARPDWAEGWLYLGRVLALQGDFADGATAAARGAELGARRRGAWLETASMADAGGDRALALAFLERALAGPVHRRWLVLRAFTASTVGDGFLALGDLLGTPEARALLTAAAERRPALHPDLLDLERRLRTDGLDAANVRALVDDYRHIVDRLPEDGELWYRLGRLEVLEAGDLEAAVGSFRRARDLGYLVPQVDGWLAYAFAHTGDHDAAFVHLERNLAAFDTPGWIFNPGEFDPLHEDPRWRVLVDRYRVENAPEVALPVAPPAGVHAPWPTREWPRAAPESVSLDSEVLQEAAREIERAYLNVTSLLVVRHGTLAFEHYFRGYGPDDAQNIKSMTKRLVMATLVGIARDQGLLPDLDTPMARILPEAFAGVDDPRKLDITLRHVLTMTAGLAYEENSAESFEWDRHDFSAAWGIALPMAHPPGEVYTYSSFLSHLLAIVVTEATGRDLLSFAHEHLFDPLGIEPEAWVRDPQGYYWGMSGLRLRPRDTAKLGLLVLRGGEWNGRQIVSTEWLREATAIHTTTSPQEAYGYQWPLFNIRGHRAIMARGFGGQQLAIIPSLDLIVGITSETLIPDNAPETIIGHWVVPAVEGATTAQPADLTARIDSVAQAALAEGPIAGLSIAVMCDGETLHARGYGLADTEAAIPATEETLFNAASVGKIIAAAAVLRLVDEGVLSLDDELATLLPDFPNPEQGRRITLRQLLNHTSGLTDYFYDYTRWEEEGTPFHPAFVFDFVRDRPLDFEPGTDWRYTNTAFYLAGMIVERVTGRPWGDYVIEEIARPLGLESVVLCDEAGAARSVGYDVGEDGGFIASIEDAETGVRGDAGLCMTASDLARLPDALTTSGLLSEAALAALLGPTVLANGVTVDAGLGVMRGSLGGHALWGHLGGNPSSNVAALVHYPDVDLSIAVLVNTRLGEVGALMIEAEVARLVLGLGEPTLHDLPLSPEAAAPYLGTYVGDRGAWRYHVVRDGERLARVWADDASSRRPLLYQGGHAFGRTDWPMDRFVFHVRDGRALGYSVYYNGLFGGLYRRSEP